ncbi:MAG: HD domain-containing protein, partial [Planctomycetota bacterium]
STEIMALEGTRVRLAGARRLGTARLFYSVGAADCQNEHALLTSIIHNVVNSAHDLYRGLPIRELLVINSVLARALLHEPGAETAPHGLRVPVEAVRTAAADAGEQCGEALAARFGVSQSDAELLQPALLTLESFLDTVPVSRIFLPEVDLVSGLFLDQLIRLRGQDPFDVFREQIKNAAMSLARKYHSEGGHSLQVTNLCRQLFDGLSDYLDLTERDRIYLEIGAILHDVGRFINDNDHHKHGHYIVIHSDLMGFSEEERNLIALLVRYHRKGRPRETHPEYASLTRRERLRVAKLASLLRLADALDREHEERVRTLHVSIGEETLDIAAEASGDLTVEKDAIRRKGTLFVDLTGLRINLRRYMG